MDAPIVAAITFDRTGGGIAAVSQLLWKVLRQECGTRARLLTMFEHENRPATFLEKARFTLSLTSAEALGRTDWVLFSHLGLAEVQNAIPGPLRRPYGVFLHGIEAWRPLGQGEQRALAGAELRLANSHYTASRVTELYPGVGRIDVCPLALPPTDRASQSGGADRGEHSLGPHAVLVVGRMVSAERYKGHDELIAAWPRIVDSVPDAQLVIVGKGDDTDRLRQKAADSGVGRRIVFTGFVDCAELDLLYQRAAIFALPSRCEGFGLVYLEAMSHRLACIGSVHDAAREVIVDGQTGHLVDQDNLDSLAEAVARLLLNKDQRMRMGEAGYCRLLAEFSFERFSERVRTLLRPGAPDRAGAVA